MAVFDRSLYPRTAAYFDALPKGFESHPECQASAAIYEFFATDFPKVADDPGLPEPVRRVFSGKLDSDWLPEALGSVVNLVARDRCFSSDAAFFEWNDTLNERLFSRPLFRALIKVLSPQLLVMGAAKRWSAMHRGTTLVAEPSVQQGNRRVVRGVLRFPENLFNTFLVEIYGRAYLVALRAASARAPAAHVERAEAREASYLLSWDA